MVPHDTTPEAERVYRAVIAAMTPAQRIERVMEMIAATDDLVRAGIRLRHPGAEGLEFQFHFLRAKYGLELAGKVCGRVW
jgi:hypothetical protein